ncbi:MAG: phage tail protein [Spirochaetaceae bacterium]|nr:phage tail protein [Spirochaetaceae bacterium]
MAIHATIDLETSSALNALRRLQREQIPYATAVALTRTAQAAQKAIRAGLPNRFKIRNDFIERGVRIQPATKSRPEAAVYWRAPGGASRREFAYSLARQETGGVKRPKRRHLALPRGVKRTTGGRIPKSQRPAQALKRRNVFVVDAGRGQAIMRRVGRGTPRLLYYLHPGAARVSPRFRFVETAEDVARRVYPKEFGRAFAKALATARR